MKYLLNITWIVFLAFAIGCSGDSKPTVKQETAEGPAGGQLASAQQASTTQNVHVYGIDKLKFVVKQKSDALKTSGTVTVNGTTYYVLEGINTQSGEEMTLTLTTISELPAASMSHNWLLLQQKADPSAFARASLQARENDYVAPEKMDLVITETGLVAPDESVTITFTTPQKPGEYEYICTFPGHFAAGMRGALYVK